ncbi:MarR family EPS-associated transcriptional regulator [Nitratifractor sp.]
MQNDELTLELLRKVESLPSQKRMAEELGISVGKTNYVLKALIRKGLIKAENFVTSQNKKAYRYLLTEEGIREKIELTRLFIERKKREYEELQLELERLERLRRQREV